MKTPYPFQELAIERGLERNVFINDECGLGKKIMALEIGRRLQATVNLPVLVITVKPDVAQWIEELSQQSPGTPVWKGDAGPLALPSGRQWWLVMHYEAMVRHISGLCRVRWGIIILDEAHYIQTWTAARSRAVKKLKAYRKVALTGTPMDKTPKDLWSPLEWLYPEQYRGRFRAFREQHCKTYIDGWGREQSLPGARDPQALAAELAPFTFARTKDEVAPDLPPNIIKQVKIDLEGPQHSLYRRIKRSTDILVKGPELNSTLHIPTQMTHLLKLHQVAVDPELVDSTADSAKLAWLYAWREGNPNEPLLVFTNYRKVAQKVAQKLNAHLVMGGSLPPTRWTKRTVVATVGAAAEALDLGWVRTAIFLDCSYKSRKMNQAIARVHRITNTEPCETIYLTARNTVDEIIHTAFTEKWEEWQVIRAYVAQSERE